MYFCSTITASRFKFTSRQCDDILSNATAESSDRKRRCAFGLGESGELRLTSRGSMLLREAYDRNRRAAELQTATVNFQMNVHQTERIGQELVWPLPVDSARVSDRYLRDVARVVVTIPRAEDPDQRQTLLTGN